MEARRWRGPRTAPASAEVPMTTARVRRSVHVNLDRSACLRVSLDEPQPFVGAACDLGADVRGRGVVEVVGFADRESHARTERGDGGTQTLHVILAFRDRGGILVELRGFRHIPRGAAGNAPQLADAVGD